MIKLKKICVISISFLLLATSCNNIAIDDTLTNSNTIESSVTYSISESTIETTTTEIETISKAQEILDDMTLEEKIYQMFIVTLETFNNGEQVTQLTDDIKSNLENQQVGGIIFFSENIEDETQITELLADSQQCTNIGLFMCIDEEGGYVARLSDKLDSTTKLNSMKYYGNNANKDDAYTIGVTLANDLNKYGFNVDFAPVSDVDLSTSNNALHELNRCFSDDPNIVALMVENVVKGLQDNGISATLKHFPGLGSSNGDTHDASVFLTRTKEEFETQDFIPIRAGINADVDFIMVGHIVVDGLSDGLPSDLSSSIVTGWLKQELDFQGIIITDSHSMNAITDNYSSGEASVMAIQSGVDIILMPENLNQSFQAVLEAVNNGEISENRIDESVLKILNQKDELGLLYY